MPHRSELGEGVSWQKRQSQGQRLRLKSTADLEQNTFLKEGVEHTDCRPAARGRLLPQKEGAGVFLFTVREGNRVYQVHLAELNGQAKHRRKWKGSMVVGSAPRAISKHPEVQRARRWLQDETPTFNNAQAMSTEQLQEGSRE